MSKAENKTERIIGVKTPTGMDGYVWRDGALLSLDLLSDVGMPAKMWSREMEGEFQVFAAFQNLLQLSLNANRVRLTD